ncbi:TetR/AcrR family transcriptional regulator [Fodinicola feengrottensis]|uniref:TetR/AcrR family transcriptional regulator n=1 Tax=Fodinicola feengrottensis TaxID=435914 RepID=A0ABN2GXW7_9ACTN
MSEAKRAGGRPRDPDNDTAILQAALELLIERGADGASIEQVAKRAGVARLTVYRRFANKEELLIKAVETARTIAAPRLAELASLSVEELVEAWALAMAQPGARNLLARLLGTLPDNPRLFGTYWEAYIEPRRAIFAVVVERERDAGRLPADTDPELFQDTVAGTLFYRLMVNPVEVTVDQMRDYLRAVLHQLGYRADPTATVPRRRDPQAE